MSSKKPQTPKVSICIPTYNGARYVGKAVSSVLDQTFADFELIVIDDCSSDNSVSEVSMFRDDRLRLVKNSNRLGLTQNWNQCLRLSRGEYIQIFHQDDVMLPQNLEKKVAVLNENKSVGLVFSQAEVIDGEEQSVRAFSDQTILSEGIQVGKDFFDRFFLQPNVICCPSVMVRKSCYELLGAFDARLSFACDFEMWMRISLFFDIAYLDEPLINYREHDQNESRNFYDHVDNLREKFLSRILLLDKFPQQVSNSRDMRVRIRRDYSEQALSLANHLYSHKRYDAAKALLKFSRESYRPIVFKDRFIRLTTKLLLGEQGTRWVMSAKRARQN
jgi:glycosyltransferase involved in cell wall biosynthesis